MLRMKQNVVCVQYKPTHCHLEGQSVGRLQRTSEETRAGSDRLSDPRWVADCGTALHNVVINKSVRHT